MSVMLGPSVLDSSLFIPELRPRRKESVLQELVDRAHMMRASSASLALFETLRLRERAAPSAIGKGVAIPHARSSP